MLLQGALVILNRSHNALNKHIGEVSWAAPSSQELLEEMHCQAQHNTELGRTAWG